MSKPIQYAVNHLNLDHHHFSDNHYAKRQDKLNTFEKLRLQFGVVMWNASSHCFIFNGLDTKTLVSHLYDIFLHYLNSNIQ